MFQKNQNALLSSEKNQKRYWCVLESHDRLEAQSSSDMCNCKSYFTLFLPFMYFYTERHSKKHSIK